LKKDDMYNAGSKREREREKKKTNKKTNKGT
jgi:hypothetical protein